MFPTSSFSTAMCTASPRAQLHMLHVQDRLRSTAPDAPFARTREKAAGHVRPSSPTLARDSEKHASASAGRSSRHPVDILSPQQQDSRRVNARRARSRGTRYSDPLSLLVPRRSSSSSVSIGCSTPLRRTGCSASRLPDRHVQQGYDVVTLFGFARDGSPTRTSTPLRSTHFTAVTSTHLQSAAAAKGPGRPREREAPPAIPMVADSPADVPSPVNAPSPVQRQLSARALVNVVPVSVMRIESSHLGVSALTLQLDSPRLGILSERTVSLVVSDTDDEQVEV